MAGTRDIEQDELHKKSIITNIEQHVDSIDAVLILTDGIVSRITVEVDYTFAVLSAMFPKTLVSNIAFMFTNVRDPRSWRFSQEMLPEALKNAPQFLLDNPLALQNRFKNDPNKKGMVKACEQRALEMLVTLFDWLDGLKPQPAAEIVSLYEKYENIEAKTITALAQADQAVAMKAEIDKRIVRLMKNSAVSLFTFLAPGTRVSSLSNVGHGCFLSH